MQTVKRWSGKVIETEWFLSKLGRKMFKKVYELKIFEDQWKVERGFCWKLCKSLVLKTDLSLHDSLGHHNRGKTAEIMGFIMTFLW